MLFFLFFYRKKNSITGRQRLSFCSCRGAELRAEAEALKRQAMRLQTEQALSLFLGWVEVISMFFGLFFCFIYVFTIFFGGFG